MRSRRSWPNAPRAWKRKGPMAAARVDMQGIPAHIMGPRLVLMLSVLALTLLGFVMIYSTSSVIALASASADAVATVDPMGRYYYSTKNYFL